MTKFVAAIFLGCLLTSALYAQGLPSSDTPAGPPSCSEGVTRACRAAADELAAARRLIDAQGAQVLALEARIQVEIERAGLLEKVKETLERQVENLKAELAAERDAKAALQSEIDARTARLAQLERTLQSQRGRSRVAWAVVAALVVTTVAKR